ncbi:MAG: YlxM family DNA-binding protein [Erysipelotrichaceae bacterium]
MEIEKTTHLNTLFDWYESLLTSKQRDIFTMYYKEDFSLAEISEEMNVSRAAVSDLLKRVGKILEDYEEKLKLVEKYHTRMEIYDRIKALQMEEVSSFVEMLIENE